MGLPWATVSPSALFFRPERRGMCGLGGSWTLGEGGAQGCAWIPGPHQEPLLGLGGWATAGRRCNVAGAAWGGTRMRSLSPVSPPSLTGSTRRRAAARAAELCAAVAVLLDVVVGSLLKTPCRRRRTPPRRGFGLHGGSRRHPRAAQGHCSVESPLGITRRGLPKILARLAPRKRPMLTGQVAD